MLLLADLWNLANYLTEFALIVYLNDLLQVFWRVCCILRLCWIAHNCSCSTMRIWFFSVYWLWWLDFFACWNFCICIITALWVLVGVIAKFILTVWTSAIKLLLFWTIKRKINAMLFIMIESYFLSLKKFMLNFGFADITL